MNGPFKKERDLHTPQKQRKRDSYKQIKRISVAREKEKRPPHKERKIDVFKQICKKKSCGEKEYD